MSQVTASCSVCGKAFEVRFSYQAQSTAEGTVFFCSQRCHERSLYRKQTRRCDICGDEFTLSYAFQQIVLQGQRVHVCSTACRTKALEQTPGQRGPAAAPPARRATTPVPGGLAASPGPLASPVPGLAVAGPRAHRIAVLNQKGGTGKTTSAVSLAAGLALKGYRTLIIDMDAQGNVGVSLGGTQQIRYTLYHVLLGQVTAAEAAVQVRENLWLLPANETLAACEIKLAQMPKGRDRVLAGRMEGIKAFDYVILDCGPSLSLLNQNALTYADQVLIPVSCDYLSLIGVKQILKTLKMVNEILLHPITILGVLPTFYDQRNRISGEAVQTLREHFKEGVLPPIRVNVQLKEAPSHRLTIFEYAPKSSGAEDYTRLVHWLIARNTGVGEKVVEASIAEVAPELAHDDFLGPVMGPVGRPAPAARGEARS